MNWIKPHKGVGALFNAKSSYTNDEKTINNIDLDTNNSLTENITGNSFDAVPETPCCKNTITPVENTPVYDTEAETDNINIPEAESTEINITGFNDIEISNLEAEPPQDSSNLTTEEKSEPAQQNDKTSEKLLNNTSKESDNHLDEDETGSSVVPFDDIVKFYISSIKRKRNTQ
jgi:hypothetical protein